MVLQGLEKMCDDCEAWMTKKSGLLIRAQDDLTARQRERLRSHMEQLRSELQRLTEEMEINIKRQSRQRAITALLSSNIVNLEESDSKSLRGYGRLPEETAQRLDTEISRLTTILEQMMKAMEQG